MSLFRITRLIVVACVAASVNCQSSGWVQNQVDATMCSWASPRAATIRDAIYIDGGILYWTPGLANGQLGPPTLDTNPLGTIYQLNFTKPFNLTSTNMSAIFDKVDKGAPGALLNNIAPNYIDGAMLANDHEFFLYGGLLTKTDAYSPPNSQEVLEYQAFQYGPYRSSFQSGFLNDILPDGLTRYRAYGGAANAPSENQAYYFSGMRSRSGGPIYKPTVNESLNALDISDTLVTLDMTEQLNEKWRNVTVPDNIKGRGGSSLVWVPVGEKGILVSLGGVVYPDFVNGNTTSENEGQSKADSPKFMSDVDIYDIANNKWYTQTTIAGPGPLALGCAVVAPAQDFTSYNIYYYGGYDGLSRAHDFNDDVWILSLPSFMWMKVSSGRTSHGRAGHRCMTPYPDQMVVLGGYPAAKGAGSLCVEGGIVQLFNMTSGKWMESYDPEVWSEYGVPEMIHLMIGGDYKGSATMVTPTPTGWNQPELASVFAKAYPTSKLKHYYPYTPNHGTASRENMTSGGMAPWVAPVLGVVLGLVFITAIVVAILLYRRRKQLRKGGASDSSTDENGNRVLSWIRGQDGSQKAGTVTTEDAPTDDLESRVGGVQTPHPTSSEMVQTERPTHYNIQEMPETTLVELMDTSPRVELGDTGLTPVDIINKHSHFATRQPGSTRDPSSLGSNYSVSHDHASISTNSQSRMFGTPPTFDAGRPDSPAIPHSMASPTPTGSPLGTGPLPSPPLPSPPLPSPPLGTDTETHSSQPSNQQPVQDNNNTEHRIVSDLSSVSHRDASHLRNLSDATVSSATGTGSAPGTPVPQHAFPAPASNPVSPPSADGREAPDYMSVGRTLGSGPPPSGGNNNPGTSASPLRRSVFYESKDDLGDGTEEHGRR